MFELAKSDLSKTGNVWLLVPGSARKGRKDFARVRGPRGTSLRNLGNVPSSLSALGSCGGDELLSQFKGNVPQYIGVSSPPEFRGFCHNLGMKDAVRCPWAARS